MANQKQKTHRGAAKRFKVSAGGKVRRHQAGKSHILTKKTSKRKRHLRGSVEAPPAASRMIKHLLQT